MATATVGSRATPGRRRGSQARSPRPTGEDRARAILGTAERLLAERGVDGFSVDDLARGAGLSRPTFYFYFASKDAVVLALLERVVDEAFRSAPQPDLAAGPVPAWRAVIESLVEVFGRHRAVVLGAVQAQAGSPAIRDLWQGAMERWVALTASLVESERARGAAVAGLPARDLAVALNLMNERVLLASFTAQSPSVDAAAVTDTLLAVWVRAIYGSADPSSSTESGAGR